MDIAALTVSIFAFIVACISLYFAWQQVAAANAQAQASKEQAAVATKALNHTVSWHAEEGLRAEPQFRVNVEPIDCFPKREEQVDPTGERFLGRVDVVVENTSSRDATIDHIGIKSLTGSTHCLSVHDPGIEFPSGIEFPHRLASGHLIPFSVPGSYFFAFLGDGTDGLPEKSEFVVFVSNSHFLSDGKRWNSRPFAVRLPSFPWLDQ
jgi:hypothetical protein